MENLRRFSSLAVESIHLASLAAAASIFSAPKDPGFLDSAWALRHRSSKSAFR